MKTGRVEMKKYLRDLEIQAHLDKLKHRNRAKRWDMPSYSTRKAIKYSAYPGRLRQWMQGSSLFCACSALPVFIWVELLQKAREITRSENP